MQTNASLTKSKLSGVRQNYFHRAGFLIEDLDQGKNFHALPRIPVLTIAVPFASYGIYTNSTLPHYMQQAALKTSKIVASLHNAGSFSTPSFQVGSLF
jgi:hypothetical protein